MRLAEEGLPTVAFLVVLTLALFIFSPWLWIDGAAVVLCGFAFWFYRDPDRTPPEGEGILTAPADGKVVEILPATHPFTGEAPQVGV